jgi:2-iminobutanoate/2-iminopropanoate deaminase
MATMREVVNIPGHSTRGSVPMGVKIGSMVFSSSIMGWDPETGKMGEGPERQFELAFQNLKTLVEQAGATTENVGLVIVFIRDGSYRSFINKPWLKIFPDEYDRPARKTTATNLPEGVLVQLQLFGVVNRRRKLLEIPGLSHRDPLPMGVEISGRVFSSVIGGQDPRTGKPVQGPEGQIEQAFQNMRILMEQAGGTTANVGHVWVFLRDRTDQPAMVKTWLKMFPDDGDRPARKTIMYNELKGRETAIQLQFTGALGSKRQNFEIPGVGHHDPIPMGAKLGNLLFSSGVGGYDPTTGKRGEGLERQAELAFQNMRTLVERAGVTTNHIAQVTVLLKDLSSERAVMQNWLEMFPDKDNRPANHTMALGLAEGNLVQLHMIAVA